MRELSRIRTIIILLTFSYFLVLTSASNQTNLCQSTYFFVISHLDENNNIKYTELELYSFANTINISIQNATNYILNYTSICLSITNLSIPKPESEQSEELKKVTKPNCENKIDRKFIGYDMDLSFPLPDFILGDVSCAKVELYRWFVDIESDGIGGYKSDGLKFFWFIFITIIIISIAISKVIKSTSILDEEIKDISKTLPKSL